MGRSHRGCSGIARCRRSTEATEPPWRDSGSGGSTEWSHPTADLIEAHVPEGTDYGPVITNFRWGHIEDSAGRTFKDARLYPCGAAEWDWRKTGTRHVPGIQIADVEDLLSTRPQTVILTRGVELALQVPDRTVQFVQNAGPSVLVLQTEAAVAEYNRRVRTERVVAIVHSTC